MKKLNKLIAFAICLCQLAIILCATPVSAAEVVGYESMFGYSQMKNNEEKQMYVSFYNAVRELNTSVPVPENTTLTGERIQEIAHYIVNDQPEAFYFRGATQVVSSSGGQIKSVHPVYNLDGTKVKPDVSLPETISALAEIKSRKVALENKVSEIINGIPANVTSDMEVTRYIHDYIANHVIYKESANDQTVYGALMLGECVCSGYAAAFSVLCNRVGIKCWYVEGYSQNTASNGPHAWNVAWINGNCLYTDVTWDDQGALTYDYFNVNGNTFNKYHLPREDYKKALGSCNHQSSTYSVSETASITLDKANAILYSRGETFALRATVTCENNVKKTVEWTTSDNAVAIVDNNGVVTAVGGGKATITATHVESGKTAKCIVTVNAAKPHEHKIEAVTGKDATCTEAGVKDYFKCASCGMRFHDEAGTEEVIEDKELEIKALGHTEGEWGHDSEKHWRICSVCHEPIEKTMRDHQIRDNVCNACGYDSTAPTEPFPTEPPTTEPSTPTEPTEPNTEPTTSTPTEATDPDATRPVDTDEEDPKNSKAVIIFGIILCAGMAAVAIYIAVKPKKA